MKTNTGFAALHPVVTTGAPTVEMGRMQAGYLPGVRWPLRRRWLVHESGVCVVRNRTSPFLAARLSD